GVVRHPGRPFWHHGPVQAALGLVGRAQQGQASGRGDARSVLTPGPDRGQYHAGAALDQIRNRRGGPRHDLQGGVPPPGGHQLGEPGQGGLLTARGEQPQRGHVPAQPVIQRRLGPGRQQGTQPRPTAAPPRAPRPRAGPRCAPSSPPPGPTPPIPAYTESRSGPGPAGGSSPATASGSHGPSSSRTWPKTHAQAASPSSRYPSPAVIQLGYGGSPALPAEGCPGGMRRGGGNRTRATPPRRDT